ncbi:MAG: anti-sigma factor [Pseudomonadota bacterium]
MSGGPDDFEDDIALAGEYVLGLLPSVESAAFEARLLHEAPLRQLIVDWDEALVPLTDDIAPITPPRGLIKKIEKRAFADAPSAPRQKRGLGAVFGALAGAVAAALIVAAILLINPTGPTAPAATHSAELRGETSDMLLEASLNQETGTIEIALVAGSPPEGRVLELWLIVPDDDTIVSMGVVPAVLPLTEAQRAKLMGAVLAVSDEPPGGSPTGQATGSVLALGDVVPISAEQ